MRRQLFSKQVAVSLLVFASIGICLESPANERLTQAEAAMKATNEKVLKPLNDDEAKERFIAAQRAWSTFRDRSVDFLRVRHPEEAVWMERKIALTIERTLVLQDLLGARFATGTDWTMLGGSRSRNAVVPSGTGPLWWQVEGGFDAEENVLDEVIGIRWMAKPGSASIAQPVVSGHLVWIGTNNGFGDDRSGEDAAVLACFDARTGIELYRYVSARRPRPFDFEYHPMRCTPLIEGDRMWFNSNRCETVCLDIGPLKRGEGDPRSVWKLDMAEEFGVFPHAGVMGYVRTSSPASYKDWLYVVTNNGTDWSHQNIPAPEAPSLLCLDKHTGKLIWEDASPGSDLVHGQSAIPLVAEVEGKVQVVVPQGDGWVRAFDPAGNGRGRSKIIWEFNMNPKGALWQFGKYRSRNNILAAPVFYRGRIYIGSGQDPENGEGSGRLCCIDPTKRGDISSELAVDASGDPLPHRRVQQVDAEKGEKVVPNPNSGLVWDINGYKDDARMSRTTSNVAIKDDLLISLDYRGMVRCLDARTGDPYWDYDTRSHILGSPLIVGDRVYAGNEDGEMLIFGLSKDPKLAMTVQEGKRAPLAAVYMPNVIYASPCFANDTFYLATGSRLYAIPQGVEGEPVHNAARGHGRPRLKGPRSPFVPTPYDVVEKMPELAKVEESDLVYDLGSGDGRIVIKAAERFGCRAIGYEINKGQVDFSRERIKKLGLESKVTIRQQDLFTAELGDADVIAVFLLPIQLEALLPKFEKLKPGARIVAHEYAIPGLEPDRSIKVESKKDGSSRKVHLYTAPVSSTKDGR